MEKEEKKKIEEEERKLFIDAVLNDPKDKDNEEEEN